MQPLPIEVPAVHVDLLWHRSREVGSAQRWLREAVVRAVAAAPHEDAC